MNFDFEISRADGMYLSVNLCVDLHRIFTDVRRRMRQLNPEIR